MTQPAFAHREEDHAMNHPFTNYGSSILNDRPIGAQATIAATGMGRSGTSMIARIMHGIGLQMEARSDVASMDDKEIQELIVGDRWEEFDRVCRRRDRDHAVWAFKDPKLRKDLGRAADILRSPRFIVVFRDILAIALRNNITVKAEIMEAIRWSLKGYQHIFQQIKGVDAPILLLSYEKALQFPVQTVTTIADFYGTPMEASAAEDVARRTIVASDPRYLGRG